jgi:hypothetical protein
MKRKISLWANLMILMAMASVGGLAGLWGAILSDAPPVKAPTAMVYNDPATVVPARLVRAHERHNN